MDDAAGRIWSRTNYPGGYTSYASQHRLYEISPTFDTLRRLLKPHLAAFARSVEWDLRGRKLAMTDCWVNIMPHQVVHSLHLHPLSSVSGTYYVQVPAGGSGIKFEDPRLERFMAAPPRKRTCTTRNRQWVTLAAVPGQVVLFESWLRHEVTANTRRQRAREHQLQFQLVLIERRRIRHNSALSPTIVKSTPVGADLQRLPHSLKPFALAPGVSFRTRDKGMTTVIARQVFAALVLTGAGMMAMLSARAAGPQIMIYVTVPLDGHTHSHVFGLRLDRAATAPDIRTINPTSPLNRRALLDLQLGAHSALRLELDRRLTWDFDRQQWHESSLPATFTLRVPTREKPATQDARAAEVASSSLADLSALTASLANPFQNQSGKPLARPFAIAP